jgi:hypothetical protein
MNIYSLFLPTIDEEAIMPRKIRSAAVIGSGIMGGGIAALLAA